MVHDDRDGRVVMMRLGKEAAFTLARTLNVAELEAPLIEEKAKSRPQAKPAASKPAEAKQAAPKEADVKKT